MTNLKSIRNIFSLIVITMLMSSCSNDEDNITSDSTLSEEEAISIIETSLQSNSGGLAETTGSYSAELSSNPSLESLCNVPQEELFTFNYEEALVTANYNISWKYQLSCNDFNIPQSISFSSSSTGVFSGQRMSSNDKASSEFLLTGLQPSDMDYIFDGAYKREGSQSLTTNFNSRNITSSLRISLENLIVSKSTNTIVSGSGTLILSGNTEQTEPFLFEGVIEFLGNGQAIIKINGNVYEIDIN